MMRLVFTQPYSKFSRSKSDLENRKGKPASIFQARSPNLESYSISRENFFETQPIWPEEN